MSFAPAIEPAVASDPVETWPADVELILSALEVGGGTSDNRRRQPRMPYRAIAALRLFSDPHSAPAWRLYTRDVSSRGIGFVAPDRLPLGYGGVVTLLPPRGGRVVSVHGTLYRCREVGHGWFEGALYFNRDQWMFAAE